MKINIAESMLRKTKEAYAKGFEAGQAFAEIENKSVVGYEQGYEEGFCAAMEYTKDAVTNGLALCWDPVKGYHWGKKP